MQLQRSTNAKRDWRESLAVSVGAKAAERTARRAAATGLGSSRVKQAGRVAITTIAIIIGLRRGAVVGWGLRVFIVFPPGSLVLCPFRCLLLVVLLGTVALLSTAADTSGLAPLREERQCFSVGRVVNLPAAEIAAAEKAHRCRRRCLVVRRGHSELFFRQAAAGLADARLLVWSSLCIATHRRDRTSVA